jgi:hypothetical protein
VPVRELFDDVDHTGHGTDQPDHDRNGAAAFELAAEGHDTPLYGDLNGVRVDPHCPEDDLVAAVVACGPTTTAADQGAIHAS